MRNYLAFMRKELIEGIRNYKAIILIAVFVIFGIMNPLFAKLMPELLSSLGGDGFAIQVPDPTALDSWTQFFKNVSQMGFLVLLILYSGIISSEISKGTLINMLTKGLSRTTVILAKYSMLILTWTLSYALCLLVTWGYTVYLFPDNNADNLVFAVVILWLFGVLLISIQTLAAASTKSNYACLLATGAAIVVMFVVSIVPAAHNYNPLSLATDSSALMASALNPSDLISAIVISVALSLACLVAAILVFRKRQL